MSDQPERGRTGRPDTEVLSGELLGEIAAAIRDIRYGSVEIVIHDSRVVQVERREKVRFPQQVNGTGRTV